MAPQAKACHLKWISPCRQGFSLAQLDELNNLEALAQERDEEIRHIGRF